MYKKFHTKGIIISSKIESDNSKRINVFTEDLGLVSARVQGVRLLRSKLRNNTQDFSLGDFSLVHGKSGWRIVGAKSEINLFEFFKNDFYKLKIVGNILNLIKKLVDEDLPAQTGKTYSLFDAVVKFFGFLKKAKQDEIPLAECLTLMRVLHILGYMDSNPELAIPLSSSEIEIDDLETIAPQRLKMVRLINESLKTI